MRKSIWLIPFVPALLGAGYPRPTGHVNDFANVLSPETERTIESRLREYAQATSIEIAVVTAPTLDGRSVEEYTVGLATEWGVGNKEKDNGVVFLHAPTERKLRIEVGYGLEPDLPDLVAGRIIRDATPNYKRGDFNAGATAIVEAVIGRLGDVPYAKRDPNRKPAAAGSDLGLGMIVLIIVLVLLVLIVLVVASSSDYGGGGGGYYSSSYSGGGGGGGGSSDSGGGFGGFGGGGFGGGGASGGY